MHTQKFLGRTVPSFLAVFMVSVLTLGGCYVESLDEHTRGASGDQISSDPTNRSMSLASGGCRRTNSRGCFEGHVVSKKAFSVDGKNFFNADDLATRFHELLTVESLGARLIEGDDYTLELTTPLDNHSFVQGFEYYLTGETARLGKLGSNGSFSINELPEGAYDLRIQRSVHFVTVEKPKAANTSEPQSETQQSDETPHADDVQQSGEASLLTYHLLAEGAQAAVVSASKVFCATLYADASLEIGRGRSERATFGEFQLHVTDHECKAGQGGAKLTLRR